MTALSSLLRKKMSAKKMSASQAAQVVRISYPTFQGALTGARVPNARCIPKYAKFLGISPDAVLKAAGPKASRRTGGLTHKRHQLAKVVRGIASTPARGFRKQQAILAKVARALDKATAQLEALAQASVSPIRPSRFRTETPKPKKAKKAKMAGRRGRPPGRKERQRYPANKHRGKKGRVHLPNQVSKAKNHSSPPPTRGATRDAGRPIKPAVVKPLRTAQPAALPPATPSSDAQPPAPAQ
jgi:hypothetical protein